MRPAVCRLLVATVVLGCGGATCLYSGAGPIDAGGPAMRGTWGPGLALFADLLTVPIPTAGIADVRDIVLLVCTGVVLILSGATKAVAASLNPITSWMSWCATAVIGLAVISASIPDSFDLSWGWIVRFAAGATLAIVISIRFTPAMVRQTVGGLVAVGVAAILLGIWHRANRGYAHFSWPIGPITITGGMAAVWAALAGVLGVGYAIGRTGWTRTMLVLAAFALCVYALEQTERRSPALGLVASFVAVAAIAVWQRFPRKAVKLAICAGVFAAVAGASVYVIIQARSTDRETSGPIVVRQDYWKQSAKFVGQHPLLGIGPDRFVIEMTKTLAPLRAEMPHVYHGNLDTAAHNEWLQAAVELGLPAGLAYAMLPIGVVSLAIRRPHRQSAGATPVLVLALAGAVISLFVCEGASINLRGPILPIWYWTLLGLLAAAARPPTPTAKGSGTAVSTRRLRPILMIAGGLVCLALSFSESLASVEAARNVFPETGWPPSRLFCERTLGGRYAAAEQASSEGDKRRANAEELWKGLFDLLPVYRETTARYAESLIQNGRSDEAKRVLESVIASGMNPYDVSANAIYATLLTNDPVGQIRCLQRILRNGSVDELPKGLLTECMKSSATQKVMSDELPLARSAAVTVDSSSMRDDLIELLRINAVLTYSVDPTQAIEDQRLVAACYKRLEQANHVYRRGHNAEYDAFYQLADYLFSSNRKNYKTAYEAIVEAEKYAVLGIKHEKPAHPNPEIGFIGGEIVPTEFPERLRPMWRLATILHMAAGDFGNIDLRLFASLPPQEWTPSRLNEQKRNLAGIAFEAIAGPKNNRPSYYYELARMAGLPMSEFQVIPSTQP